MKHSFLTTFLICIAMPSVMHAATLTNVQSVSSSSGGVTAEGGETVVTSPSSASSQIHTTITGSSEGSDVRVEITTEKDGTRYREVREERVTPNVPVTVTVATSSSSRAIRAGVKGVSVLEENLSTKATPTISFEEKMIHVNDWGQSLRLRLESLFSHLMRLFPLF